MASPSDQLIQIDTDNLGGSTYRPSTRRTTLTPPQASPYTVEVTKPRGVLITKVGADKFDPEKTYKVAINSYRANGGGRLSPRELA